MDIPRGSIKDVTLFSKELMEDVKILIYLPHNFSTLYKYSLLIAQDGQDYFQLGRIGRVADQLHHEAEIEQLIIVGIPYKDVNDRRAKYHPNGEKNSQYIRFLAHELIPYLDQEFPTYLMGMGRALIGDSLGGTVSLMAALQYPHTFGKVLLQSPFVDINVLNAVSDCTDSSLLSIYHVYGSEETNVKTTDGQFFNFVESNEKLTELLNSKKFPYVHEIFQGDHTWTYWQPNLIQAMREMF